MTFAQSSRTVQTTETQQRAPKGPVLIDPKHFKLIGGGLPHGTWAAAPAPAAQTSLPHGTW